MPTELQQLQNRIDEAHSEMRRLIKEHEHDGNQSSQIKTLNLFDQGKNINAIRYFQFEVVEPATDVTTGDGKHYIHIPIEWDRFYLIEVHAMVITAGATGTTDIQIANVTDAVDMLSTKITIDSGETGSDTAATAAVIDLTKDEIAKHDLLRIDVDAISTTAPKGLVVTLGFAEFRK